MNAKQKNQFKSEISSLISYKKLTIEDIKKVTKSERQDFVNNELLTINKLALQWALKNKIISPDELKTNEFFTNNTLLNDFISETGIGALGVGGAIYALNVAIAPVFLGFGGGLAAVGAAGVVTIAAPVVLAGFGILGIIKWKENKELERLEEYFIVEQAEILNFYYAKINKLKNTPIAIAKVKTVEKIEEKVIQKDTTEKATPSPKETLEKDIKPIIKKIEKDIYYNKCVVRYDTKLNACTIKHEDTTWDKKDGLNHKTFKDSIDKLLLIIGDEIFNWEDIEIIFIGTEAHFIELKKKVKVFEKDNKNKIDKAIIIIAKKEKSSNE